jgi:hypothetical protein
MAEPLSRNIRVVAPLPGNSDLCDFTNCIGPWNIHDPGDRQGFYPQAFESANGRFFLEGPVQCYGRIQFRQTEVEGDKVLRLILAAGYSEGSLTPRLKALLEAKLGSSAGLERQERQADAIALRSAHTLLTAVIEDLTCPTSTPAIETCPVSVIRLKAHLDENPPFLTLDDKPVGGMDEVAVVYVAELIKLNGGRLAFTEFIRQNPNYEGSISTRIFKKLSWTDK